jgi:Tol biopolymer transport system component
MLRSATLVGAVVTMAACGSSHHAASSTTAAVAPVSTAAGAVTPARGVVYFEAGPEGDQLSLYAVGADGGGLTQARAAGAISPDGSLALRTDGRGVAISPLAGGSTTVVRPPRGVALEAGVASPDGTAIALSGTNGIYVMRPSRPGLTRITSPGSARDVPLAWSPDGSRLLLGRIVSSDETFDSDNLMVVKADGSGLVRINPPGTVSGTGGPQPGAAWSPDGTRIVFVASEGGGFYPGGSGVYVAAADGSGARVLQGTENALWPSWSPDGQWLAYDLGPHHELYVVHPDGSGTRQLTNGGDGPFSVAPVWSPDSQRLLFLRGEGEDFAHTQLWTVRIDGSELRQLTHRALEYDGYAWLEGPA